MLSFLKPFPELRRYYRRQWWVIPILPLFNLAVFFIRLAGIVNSIGTDSAWKTATLTDERRALAGIMAQDFSRPVSGLRRLRSFVNDDSKGE